jgi:TetR/AcrR family transcriptional repressor of nem operon
MARPRSYDRDEAVRAAERQFRHTGYNGTSVDDIATATRLGRGSLYAAFGDKHGLFLQAMEGYSARLDQLIAEALSGPDDAALERLHQFLLAAVDGVPLGPGLAPAENRAASVCFAAKMAFELGATDAEAARAADAALGVVQAALATCVRAAQRSGDLDPDVDSDELAWLLLTIVRGIDVMAAAGQSPSCLTSIAERAFACLPFTHTDAHGKGRDSVRCQSAPNLA